MVDNLKIRDLISAFKDIPKAKPQDNLGSALDSTESSHEPVFVFNNSKFLGLVSVHRSLFHNKYPYTTELQHVLIVPPHIFPETSVFDAVEHMLSTRFYTLPVFNKSSKIVGLVRAEDILKEIAKDEKLLDEIAGKVNLGKPEIFNINAPVRKIYHFLKDKNFARIVLTDDNGKLVGIVARRDVKHAFIRPTQRIRFSKKEGRINSYSFDEEELRREDRSIRSYYQKDVFTIEEKSGKKEIIKKLLGSDKNSIVVVNRDFKPVGIVSVRDVLKGIISLRPEREIQLIIRSPSSNVGEKETAKAYELIKELGKKINKREAVQKIEISFEEPKSSAHTTVVFNTLLIFDFYNGERLVAKSQQHEFMDSIRGAINEIEKQLRRKSK